MWRQQITRLCKVVYYISPTVEEFVVVVTLYVRAWITHCQQLRCFTMSIWYENCVYINKNFLAHSLATGTFPKLRSLGATSKTSITSSRVIRNASGLRSQPLTCHHNGAMKSAKGCDSQNPYQCKQTIMVFCIFLS